ncbi:cell wall-binding repeat-containing protein [Clostridium sp.]|uniref:cell wall-binding repeat-containing protein n=1 Tax=Clostridium sp. TaxID=1506 RepID=UPI003216BEB8
MGITTERLGGIDRYETSVKISEKVGNNGEFVVATGEGFADSLSISSVAAKKGMPILLTSNSGLSDHVKSYLSKQTVSKTYVIGGTGVISNQIMQQLRNAETLGGIDM